MHVGTRAFVELKETKVWLKPQDVTELAVKHERTYYMEMVTQGTVAEVGS